MKILIFTVKLLIAFSSSACSEKHSHHSPDKFPHYFSFGVASSAYQIEGAWNEDDRGPSVWDTFTHDHPEKIANMSDADVSADSYHFFSDGVRAINRMGLDHYCFSISWSRILPDGIVATINQAAINYYNRLIDKLLSNGIKPIVTMFKYDLPQTMQNLGGFVNDVTIDYFEAYADVLFKYFGDRVKKWITFDSPYLLCNSLYNNGFLAPTIVPVPGIGQYLCGHNVLKAHANVYRMYHRRYANRHRGKVGITLYSNFYYSKTNIDTDVDKAIAFELGWFANPIFSQGGDYPTIMRKQIDSNSLSDGYSTSRLPEFSRHAIAEIRRSADFMGLAYYTSRVVDSVTQPIDQVVLGLYPRDALLNYTVRPEWPQANSSFLYSVPHGLGDLLKYIKKEYNNPEVLITANGWSDDGDLNDQGRIDYLRAHLKETLNSVRHHKCNLVGYTAWTLENSFEYLDGYLPKFGLFDVNFTSPLKELTPKASAKFIKELTSTRCIPKNILF